MSLDRPIDSDVDVEHDLHELARDDDAQKPELDPEPHHEHRPQPDPPAYRLHWVSRCYERGWAFTPVIGKRPYVDAWQSQPRATLTDTEEWTREKNIAVRTGSVSGVVVVDDDTEDQAAERLLDLPPTPTAITGSGHRHFYFQAPSQPLKNSTSKLAPQVDFKGENGAVVFVGSVHPDTGRMYHWIDGRSPDDVELAELPDALLQELLAPPEPCRSEKRTNGAQEVKPRHRNYAKKALGGAFDDVVQASEGCRNDTLNRSAFRMGQFVGAGMIDRQEVEDALADAAKQAGLTSREATSTVRSGFDAGCEDPFDVAALDQATTSSAKSSDRAQESTEHEEPDETLQSTAARPEILLEGGDLPHAVDEGERALIASGGQGIFQRGTMMIRIVKSRSTTFRQWGCSPAGALSTIEVDPLYLVERFMRSAVWTRLDRRSGSIVEIDCPPKIANTYLARTGEWKVPLLLGVIEAPTLRPDGSLLSTPGYDPDTGLYLYPTGVDFPPIPDEPTQDDAKQALGRLNEVIKDFPFVQPCDRAAALAAILTGIVRRSLRTAPLIAFRAPKMASGKSLLADVVSMIATGRPAPMMTQGKSEEEDRKRMLALLIEGEPIACIDNVDRPLGGAALCSVLTQEVWKDRLLGKSTMVTAPTSTTWLVTGNNLVFYGDITTRTIVSDLDAGCEHPETRKFDVNLYDYVPRVRPDLVAAGLTVLRAFHVAGLPDQGLPVFGRFEQWSDWVRSPLVWLGLKDPCRGRERLEDSDPVRIQLREVLVAWHALVGEERKTVAEILRLARPEGGSHDGPLWEALVGVAGERGAPNPRKLGAWLAKHERRPEGGLRIERVDERQGVALWRVRRV